MVRKSTPKISPAAVNPAPLQGIDHLERTLRETLERYELIFQATHDILYDLCLQTGKVTWNEALYTQYGYAKSSQMGTLEWWAKHIHPDDALRVENDISDWLSGDNDTWQTEYRFRKANGSYTYVRDRGFVIRASDATPLRIIGSFLDIARQKNLDRAKDDFISLVSHQLRTPLTVIRIYGEMFTNGLLGELDNVQSAHIACMTNASIRLLKLVEDILNISRIELGNFDVSPTAVNTNALIRECIQEVTPLAAGKRITITFEADETLPPLPIDSMVFTQILDNLLSNAIRYTKAARGHIAVNFSQRENEYVLSVCDNGIGIPKAAQAHIFDRFYRAPNAVNSEEQGTGLGLYLVQLMTQAFGGRVWFESVKNTGTTFNVGISLTGMAPVTRSAR
jgi:PAS domain S-box-containing protein